MTEQPETVTISRAEYERLQAIEAAARQAAEALAGALRAAPKRKWKKPQLSKIIVKGE